MTKQLTQLVALATFMLAGSSTAAPVLPLRLDHSQHRAASAQPAGLFGLFPLLAGVAQAARTCPDVQPAAGRTHIPPPAATDRPTERPTGGASASPSASPPASPPASPRAAVNAADAAFVTQQGPDLMLSGQRITLYGSTTYPYWDKYGDGSRILRGSSWSDPAFPAYIDYILDQAVAARLNTVRPTDFLDGVGPVGSVAEAQAKAQDPVVWSNMDYFLQAARSRNLFVIMSLSPYRNLLRKNGICPYQASDWAVFLDFVGERYRNEPGIAYFAIAGEPAAPNGNDPSRATASQLTDFYSETTTRLRVADGGNHLIGTGGLSYLNFNSGIDWQTIFSLPNVDLALIHAYSDGDRTVTIPMVSEWAAANAKPFSIEEFGFKQEMGDDARAAAFENMYTLALTYAQAGISFWNLGPEVAARSYSVSEGTPAVWAMVIAYAASLSPSTPARAAANPHRSPARSSRRPNR